MTDVHDHISKGITRSRLKLEARRAFRPTVLWALGILAALVGISYFVVHVSKTFGRKTSEVTFQVTDDFGVFVGVDEVRLRGVPIGRIADVTHEGTKLILTAQIQRRYAPIYRNASAEMRSITPLNDVYLNIVDPGTPSAGVATADAPIGPGKTKPLVTVPDVLDTLAQDQRLALHTILDELGNGLHDRGRSLRMLFVEAAPLIESAATLTRELDQRKAITKRLVHNTAVLSGELARREDALRRLVSTGAATVGTLQRSTPALDATLRELPTTITELRTSMQAVRGIAGDVDSGLSGVYDATERLPGALTATRRLAASLAPAAVALQPSVAALTPLVRALVPAAADLRVTASALRGQVPTVNRLTQRLVDCMAGVQNFMQWNTSLTKFGDSDAPVPRGQLAIGVPGLVPDLPARKPAQSCAPGPIVGGRPLVEGDGH